MSQSTVSLSFKSVSSASIDSLPVSNGQVIALNDTDGLYYDMGNSRHSAAEVPSRVKLTSDGSKVVRFGTDANGNYGYYKDGADTVTPFRNPLGNATADKVVAGKTFANVDSDSMTGNVPIVQTATYQFSGVSTTITQNGTYYLPDQETHFGDSQNMVAYGGTFEFTTTPSTFVIDVPIREPVITSKQVTVIPPINSESSSTTTDYQDILPDSGSDAMAPVDARLPQFHTYQKFSISGQYNNNLLNIRPSKTGFMDAYVTCGIVEADDSPFLGNASIYCVRNGSSFSSSSGFDLRGTRSDDKDQLKLDGKTVSRILYKTNNTMTGNTYHTPDAWWSCVPSKYRSNYYSTFREFQGVGLFAHCDWTASGVGGMSIDMINTYSTHGAIYTLHNSTGSTDTSGNIRVGDGTEILTVERSGKTVYHKINGTNIISWTELGAAGYIITEICIPITPSNLIFMMMYCTSAVKYSKCWMFRLSKLSGVWKATGKLSFGSDRTSRANFATAGTQWHTAYMLNPGPHYDLDPYYTVSIHEDAFAYAKNSATPSYYRTCRDLVNCLRGLNPTSFALQSTTWRTLGNATGESGGSNSFRQVIPYVGGRGDSHAALNIRGGFDKNDASLPWVAGDNEHWNLKTSLYQSVRYIGRPFMSLGLFSTGYYHSICSTNDSSYLYMHIAGNIASIGIVESTSVPQSYYYVSATNYKNCRSIWADSPYYDYNDASITNYVISSVAGQRRDLYVCNDYNGTATTSLNQVIDNIFVYHDVMIVCVGYLCFGFTILSEQGGKIFNLHYVGSCTGSKQSSATVDANPSADAIMNIFHPSRAISAIHGYDIQFQV